MTFMVGDTVPSLDQGIPNDLQMPRFVFSGGTIIVLHRGYGHQAGEVAPALGLATKDFVFATIANDRDLHGSFSVEPLIDLRSARITIRTRSEDGYPRILK